MTKTSGSYNTSICHGAMRSLLKAEWSTLVHVCWPAFLSCLFSQMSLVMRAHLDCSSAQHAVVRNPLLHVKSKHSGQPTALLFSLSILHLPAKFCNDPKDKLSILPVCPFPGKWPHATRSLKTSWSFAIGAHGLTMDLAVIISAWGWRFMAPVKIWIRVWNSFSMTKHLMHSLKVGNSSYN